MTSKTAFAVAAALSLATAGAAKADDWIVTVGGKVTTSPPYEGAGHYVTVPSPSLSIRKADHPYRYTPPDDGSTLALISTDHIVFGPIVRFQYARGDRGDLTGFSRIHPAVEPGGFLDLYPIKWFRLHGELRRGVYGHNGLVSDDGADLIYQGKRWDLSAGPRIGFGDQNYFDKYFGVTPVEAKASPFVKTPYDPTGGRRYTGGEVSAQYHLTDRLFIVAGGGYHRLAPGAADSPLVEIVGSRDQYFGTLGFTWSFGLHS